MTLHSTSMCYWDSSVLCTCSSEIESCGKLPSLLIYLIRSFYTLRCRGFFFIILQTVGLLGRVINSSQGLYLNRGKHKHRINTYRHQTSMSCVGFESTIPASERAETVHASDRSATVTGMWQIRPHISMTWPEVSSAHRWAYPKSEVPLTAEWFVAECNYINRSNTSQQLRRRHFQPPDSTPKPLTLVGVSALCSS
jgi:hypothetical protein